MCQLVLVLPHSTHNPGLTQLYLALLYTMHDFTPIAIHLHTKRYDDIMHIVLVLLHLTL